LVSQTLTPICFGTPGRHVVTIRCRDTGGAVTIGTLLVQVHDIPKRDREVLHIDDFFQISPNDALDSHMDRTAHDMLRAAGYAESEIHHSNPWGAGDRDARTPPVKLLELLRYRLLVWEVNGAGGGAQTGVPDLLRVTTCRRDEPLKFFLRHGGAVWFYGTRPIAGMTRRDGSSCQTDLSHSHNVGLALSPGDFVCDWFHICGGEVRTVKDQSTRHGLVRALPTTEAALDLFPPVEIDSTRFPLELGGIPFYEAVLQPTYDPTGGLDNLYTAIPVLSSSPFLRRPIAFRYRDIDPVPEHGPMALFLFPFHDLKQGSGEVRTGVRGMVRSMIEWFRANTDPLPP
jgi:hypothetical protein